MKRIAIDFRNIQSHADIAAVFNSIELSSSSKILITFDFGGHEKIYSDYLLLLVSIIKHFEQKGVSIQFQLDNRDDKDKLDYISRVDFFKNLDIGYQEDFERYRTIGRFTEIRAFNNENAIQLYHRMMSVLAHDEINVEMLAVLNYCLWEVIDNTLNHSGEGFTYGNGSGYGCIQYFPIHKEIRIIISDTGVGIHHALTRHPNSKYKDLTEKQAVLASVEKGVTNGEGRGFGLWATAELIKHNKGKMQIHSGNALLHISDKTEIVEAPYWPGTYTTFRLNTNIPVSEKLIFGENSSILESYLDQREEDGRAN